MIFALRRVLVLLGAIALGLLALPDGRGLALGGLLGALAVHLVERRRVRLLRPYLPPRQLGRHRRVL